MSLQQQRSWTIKSTATAAPSSFQLDCFQSETKTSLGTMHALHWALLARSGDVMMYEIREKGWQKVTLNSLSRLLSLNHAFLNFHLISASRALYCLTHFAHNNAHCTDGCSETWAFFWYQARLYRPGITPCAVRKRIYSQLDSALQGEISDCQFCGVAHFPPSLAPFICRKFKCVLYSSQRSL